ncbi:hypothetical protein Pve01_76080 [Planomonospora venezuelensis]|nr:hypothetical protein Pve01_76080 [Planomonospora venezuelensis]
MTARPDWIQLFLDTPAGAYEEAVAFWSAVTGWTPSERRGEDGQFLTLLPPAGAAYVKVQAIDGPAGVHLDLDSADRPAAVARARELGATSAWTHHDVEVMAVMVDALGRLPIPRVSFQFNNRKLIQGFYRGLGIDDVTDAIRVIDKLDKLPADEVATMLVERVGATPEQAQRCLELATIRVEDTSFVERVRALGVSDELLDQGLEELAAVVEGCRAVAGDTVGVEANLRGRRAPYVVAVDRLPELRGLSTDGPVEIGAALTLTEVEAALGDAVPLLAEVWPLFASPLIRNGATIGGNLATASPIGDLAPALLALDATVVLASAYGDREVALADFFTGYRETVLRAGELIRAVRVPTPLAAHTTFRKIAKRRYDDISSVAVAAAIDVVDGTVVRARIGLGGVAATPLRARATEAAIEGRPWTAETVEAASLVLAGEGTPIDDQRASAAYRSAMLGNALRAWWCEAWGEGESS